MVKQCIEAVEQFDESHLTEITTEVNQVLGKKVFSSLYYMAGSMSGQDEANFVF